MVLMAMLYARHEIRTSGPGTNVFAPHFSRSLRGAIHFKCPEDLYPTVIVLRIF